VIELKCAAGKTFSLEELTKSLEQHKPAVLFLCQVGLESWVGSQLVAILT
jgi:alanine-glyoxylate transaminase/serine-glyoxylate transaminase/serine-pyruvate transaminase